MFIFDSFPNFYLLLHKNSSKSLSSRKQLSCFTYFGVNLFHIVKTGAGGEYSAGILHK